MSIKIILADDHVMLRDGVKAVIKESEKDIEIIGEASNGNEVLMMAEKRPADVYILDISMPVLNGLETADRLIKRDPRSKIIILSMHDDRSMVTRALQSGIKGYLLKDNSSEELVDAIYQVYEGRFYLCPGISQFVVQGFIGRKGSGGNQTKELRELTGREREILQLMAESFSSKEISEKLNLSVHTVQSHRKNILQKLHMSKPIDIVRYAAKEGIIEL